MFFSFKHLSIDEKFTPLGKGEEYFVLALERLRDACRVRPQEMKESRRIWRCHTIKWERTTEPEGHTKMPKGFQESEPMQISLGTADGRLQGYFVGSLFFVVWFDAHHRLYLE